MTDPSTPDTVWTRVLCPRGVALLGATGRDDSPMSRPLRWLVERGYAGRVFPVNPRYDHLGGRPCYPSLAAVPGPVDLVLALGAGERAVEAVREAGAAGAAAVVVFASGFAETGPEGATRQDELVRVARESGVRVIGPNCQGLLYAPSRLVATFSAAAEREPVTSSGIAYVGQSGAIGGSVLDLAAERGLGLCAWVSTGNQADTDLCEIGRHLIADGTVSVLAVYMESVGDGAAFIGLAVAAARAGKPLVVLRSGSSATGREAAVSHTGALLGDDAAFALVARRYGVVLIEDVDELVATATVLARARRPRGRGVAVVTTSGGAGTIAADRCAAAGLSLPPLASPTRDGLTELVPAFGSVANPVDVTAQLFNEGARAFGEVCRRVGDDDAVDMLLVVVTLVVGDAARELAHDVAASTRDLDVPCVVVWLAGQDRLDDALSVLGTAGVPVLSSITVATHVLHALAVAAETDTNPEVPPAPPMPGLAGAVAAGDGWAVLDAAGIRRPRGRAARSAAEAAVIAGALGPRVVMKAVVAGLEHKTEAGAVRLDVDATETVGVYRELTAAVPGAEAVLVQEAVPAGVELMVDGRAGQDGWPPVLTVGWGGTAVEVHGDVASALAPVDAEGAMALLRSLRSWPLLAGHRGLPGRDVAAAADVLVRVARAVSDPDGPVELEINPVIVGREGEGAVAVDVVLAPPTGGPHQENAEVAWVAS